jgi:hypothetical protein
MLLSDLWSCCGWRGCRCSLWHSLGVHRSGWGLSGLAESDWSRWGGLCGRCTLHRGELRLYGGQGFLELFDALFKGALFGVGCILSEERGLSKRYR